MKKILLTIFPILFVVFQLLAAESDKTNPRSPFCELQPEHEVIIYPNPVLNNTFKIKGDEIQSVEVVNVIGQAIVRKNYDAPQGEAMQIYLKKCDKGMYLVKITFKDKKAIIKKLLVK